MSVSNEAFFSYLYAPLSSDKINTIYRENNIETERSDLYRDFILSLIDLIFDTYMGDNIMNVTQRNEHFKWCWDKTIDNFKKEGIYLGENENLFKYFKSFMFEIFYLVKDKNDNQNTIESIPKLWKHIFTHDSKKTQLDIDTFIEVYKMFDKSLKIGKKT